MYIIYFFLSFKKTETKKDRLIFETAFFWQLYIFTLSFYYYTHPNVTYLKNFPRMERDSTSSSETISILDMI